MVTEENGSRLAPPENYSNWEPDFKRYFKMTGTMVNSKEITLPETVIPRRTFNAGTKLRIWFGEDLANDGTEADNPLSSTCMDVYVIYRDIWK